MAVLKFEDPHFVEPLYRTLFAFRLVNATHLETKFDVFARRQEWEERELLPNQRRVALVRGNVIHHSII